MVKSFLVLLAASRVNHQKILVQCFTYTKVFFTPVKADGTQVMFWVCPFVRSFVLSILQENYCKDYLQSKLAKTLEWPTKQTIKFWLSVGKCPRHRSRSICKPGQHCRRLCSAGYHLFCEVMASRWQHLRLPIRRVGIRFFLGNNSGRYSILSKE